MGSVQIKGDQIANAAIVAAKIASSAVGTSAIADSSITSSKLGSASVNSAAIATGALDTASFFASGVIATAALASDCVTADKVGDGEISTSALASLCVTEAKLASGSVTSSKLGTAAVQTSAVGDAQITNAKLAGSIAANKLDLTDTYDFSSGTLRVASTPTNANDASSKQYVDSVAQGSHWKKAAKCAPDTNIDISDLPASIDSQSLSTDDRFLLKSQSSSSENGVYLYKGAGNAAVRAEDMDVASEFPGAAVYILAGTNGQKSYVCTNTADPNLGTDAVNWTQFAGAGSDSITVSGGLSRTGNEISIADSGVTTAKLNNGSVTSSKLSADAVQTNNVGNAQITQSKLANDCVGADQVIDGSIGTVALASASVTEAKIGSAQISTIKLQDACITNAKLGSAVVQTSNVGDAQITQSKLANDCVGANQIADAAINASAMFSAGVVDSDALASASVTSAKLSAGAVGTSALASTSVSTAKLQDSSVTAQKLGITFAQEGAEISGLSTTTIDLGQTLPSGALNSVLVFKNGLSLRNMTALGDTAGDNDEFQVSANGGSGGVARITFGAALSNGDGIMIWYWH
ncbi:MAG: hypothetical protein ACXACD_11405 [Candidatus Thorarchaeota archaeon]|jgi:hypothetical protein